MYSVFRERERADGVYYYCREASVAYKKTGFVYADAQTVQLARLNCNTLRSLSLSLS